MKAIKVSNVERPVWWNRFTEDIPGPSARTDLPKWERYGSWIQDVRAKLLTHGGALHRRERGNEFLVTFRLDSNYTMFLLKYS